MDRAVQEAPMSLRGRMFRQDSSRPKEQRILVLRSGVAGVQFHIENSQERRALDDLTPGTELMLFREPDNEMDGFAVAVHLTKNDKLGYISRYKNETIARLMDVGKKFIAVVDDFSDYTEEELARSPFSPTENMSLPFSVYLVEEV